MMRWFKKSVAKFIRIYPKGAMNICTNFHNNSSNSCREISAWTKEIDPPIGLPCISQSYIASLTKNVLDYFKISWLCHIVLCVFIHKIIYCMPCLFM